ncbi:MULTISPECIES: DUF805 domain-containing protein [unclassified Curtobacterium]|jgi:uncharacterized membrane protein YhaH (DUF805 family)|uniref:DUF805 domain-containing protein n=1 Tax=unclassified Curtobacterium TaxID=257496 RepID=UPI00052A1C92|nr:MULTISPECIES: DUF805 domain-containing protein [unclassified Curtobacterium]AIV41009.1 hypothetical protein NI26_14560 [Curtobacterium sp. MR_MD2014]MCM3505665.1 DUF805 domain-containing protein [Curtobacterium sp. ODYSSEY 48 V2]MDB6427234.1 DUF805 domain-containing protein [Curtobacterium sp. 20TX0008]MDP9737592.1 uncharacterized membrane protein YhaH (DUF805 family) [Curtobacterium sp. 260]
MSNDSVQPGGVALRDPFYGAPFAEAVRRFWRKYTVFTGRASRSEAWWWWLTSFVIGLVLQLVPQVFTPGTPVLENPVGSYLFVLWGLATLIGSLALGARRLHDANLSGFWQFLHVVVGIGSLVLLVMFLLPPNPKGSRFD